MPRTRTLVLVLAGGAGGRLELLTHRAGQARGLVRGHPPADRLPARRTASNAGLLTSGWRSSSTRTRSRTISPTAARGIWTARPAG